MCFWFEIFWSKFDISGYEHAQVKTMSFTHTEFCNHCSIYNGPVQTWDWMELDISQKAGRDVNPLGRPCRVN
jgi:hypothetical protein